MDTLYQFYRIRVKGKIHERWQVRFEPLSMVYLPDGDTMLQGQVQDQSQLVGIINQIHNLNLNLISVNCGED